MRLYLSSYQLGAHPEVLARLVHGDRRGWVVANALDGQDERRRRTDTKLQIEALASLGLHAVDLDLRDLDPANARTEFGRPDFVWVRGGNVFTLRMALARSGLDRVVIDGLAADRFVYAGFSAAPACWPRPCTGSRCATHPTSAVPPTGRSATTGRSPRPPRCPPPQPPRASRDRLAFTGCREVRE